MTTYKENNENENFFVVFIRFYEFFKGHKRKSKIFGPQNEGTSWK
jgi:hypothetical protein